jgi:hypothetical protein
MQVKLADEDKALNLCRSKVAQRGLPMQVHAAEYQWWVLCQWIYPDLCSFTESNICATGIDASLHSISPRRGELISEISSKSCSGELTTPVRYDRFAQSFTLIFRIHKTRIWMACLGGSYLLTDEVDGIHETPNFHTRAWYNNRLFNRSSQTITRSSLIANGDSRNVNQYTTFFAPIFWFRKRSLSQSVKKIIYQEEYCINGRHFWVFVHLVEYHNKSSLFCQSS